MKAMKILFILATVFSFTKCKSIKVEDNAPFTIEKATYYTWAGGQAGVRGMNVTIQLKEASSVQFDTLYFKNKMAKVEVKNTTIVANYSMSKKLPTDIILDIDPKKEIKNEAPKTKKFPFQLEKNQAVLSYQIEGKTKYYKIKTITKAEENASDKVQ